MEVNLRSGGPHDVEPCGHICYQAFRAIAVDHNFPPDFPSPEAAARLIDGLLSHPGFYSVIAEAGGRIVGSNFLDERSTIAGVGPITVDPAVQDDGVGRRLMADVMDRAREKSFPGVRLLQAAYHSRSLALYAKLGFEVREPIATMQGAPIQEEMPGYRVREATEDDLEPCNELCQSVHGHDRAGEVLDAIGRGAVKVVEHASGITGYTTGLAFSGHSVGRSNDVIEALIGSASEFGGPGILVPMRNGELFRWCLDRGLRVVHVMTLMTVGLYRDPAGSFLPSVLY